MLIAGNWKMNTDVSSSVELARGVIQESEHAGAVNVAVCPPAPLLSVVGEALAGSHVRLGAQNMYWVDSGAFTGEISAQMLSSLGCHYVIVGHSERRQYFGETDVEVNKKVRQSVKAGLVPIICVGERLNQRKAGKEQEVVAAQVQHALEGMEVRASDSFVIAYEPVWAIGTGETATPEQAQGMHKFIRTLVRQQFGNQIADGLHILYGGSMKPSNAEELLIQNDVDGGLIGGASLKADIFGQIIQAAQKL
ncbi:MAG: triose-phosphate isomerase [Bacteroidetes bacterium]|nr:triose-phosphate isomerase [Bacteroidota bacterium]MCY4205037.1 triose-phosphate isomerase [Bacteroidota bacterium]